MYKVLCQKPLCLFTVCFHNVAIAIKLAIWFYFQFCIKLFHRIEHTSLHCLHFYLQWYQCNSIKSLYVTTCYLKILNDNKNERKTNMQYTSTLVICLPLESLYALYWSIYMLNFTIFRFYIAKRWWIGTKFLLRSLHWKPIRIVFFISHT